MIFAEFYRRNLAGKLVQACGDRSILILDGRNRDEEWHRIASRECLAREYEAYQLRKGRGFLDSKPASTMVMPSACGVPQE